MEEAHDHSQHTSSGFSLPTMLALGGGAIVAGIVLAPYVAPAIGIGDINVAEGTLFGMHNLVEGDGVALAMNKMLSYVPLIGGELAKGGITNIIATAVTGIGGVALGNWISETHTGEGIDWGKVIKWSALATSAMIALPSILTGISNGLVYIANEMVANEWIDPNVGAKIVENITGSIGIIPYQEPASLGFTGAAVTLPHLLTCGSTLFPLAASIGADKILGSHKETGHDTDYPKRPYSFIAKDTSGKPLPFGDPNHYMTPKEAALVERYNDATPAQKLLLKKEILAQGYNPDFHDDGTVHLHKHQHTGHAPGAMR
ncbi:MAG: hypothetical protein SFX19_03075 [Alphaproteobacteria bacterium]|nr:hypothetical protein [Alphaproteobacteria bacterium]